VTDKNITKETGWAGFFMPADTPPGIVKRASDDLRAALSDPEIQKAIVARGSTPDLRSLPEGSAFARSETAKWTQVRKPQSRSESMQQLDDS